MATHRAYRPKLKTQVRPGRVGAYDDGYPNTIAGWAWFITQAALAAAGVYIILVLVLSLA